jgi:8-oxo-dGTP pyrophosphatase MutT (NUDIX family)
VNSFKHWLDRAMIAYLNHYPEDSPRLQELQCLLRSGSDLRDRRLSPGHLTAGGLVLTPQRDAMVVVLHRRLNRWLQPGGHVEPGELPHEAALREVAEETGLTDLSILPAFPADPTLPLDIDSHPIPANNHKQEPPHTHHDFRYVMVLSTAPELCPNLNEVADVAVVPMEQIRRENKLPDLNRALSRLNDRMR